MWPLHRTLAARSMGAQLAVATATAAVATVAGLVEGHAPTLPDVLVVAAPVAAYIGAAWTLAAWRAEGADVALANTGVPGCWAIGWLALLSAPALLVAPTPIAPTPSWHIETAPGVLRLHSPEGVVAVRWDADGARRDDDGARFEALPSPVTRSAASPRPDRWPRQIVRLGLLLTLLGALGWRGWRPGLGPTLAAAAGACVIANLSVAVI